MTKPTKAMRCFTAARDIIAKEGDGTLDPLTVQWAHDVIAGNVTRKRAAPNQIKVMAAFEEDPFASFTRQELIEQSGLSMDQFDQASLMLRHKRQLFRLPVGRLEKPRYFASEAAMRARQADLRRAAIDRDATKVARRLEAHAARAAKPPRAEKPLKIPRLAKTKPPKPHKPVDLTPRVMPTFSVKKEAKPRQRGEVIIPAGLEIQQCPSWRDTRFTATEPIVGGFLDEWKKKRGEGA